MQIKDVRARIDCGQFYAFLGSPTFSNFPPKKIPAFSTHNNKECLIFLNKAGHGFDGIIAVIAFFANSDFTEAFAFSATDRWCSPPEAAATLKALGATEIRISDSYHITDFNEAFHKFEQWAYYMADAPR